MLQLLILVLLEQAAIPPKQTRPSRFKVAFTSTLRFFISAPEVKPQRPASLMSPLVAPSSLIVILCPSPS